MAGRKTDGCRRICFCWAKASSGRTSDEIGTTIGQSAKTWSFRATFLPWQIDSNRLLDTLTPKFKFPAMFALLA